VTSLTISSGSPSSRRLGIVAEHCVERGDHLTHHRHDRDLRQFAGDLETIVEGSKDRIPIARAHRRHVEHLADVGPPAPDATPSLERAALEGAVGGVRMGGSARQIHEPGNAPLSDDPIVKLPAVAT
jgi:hypothetical protein